MNSSAIYSISAEYLHECFEYDKSSGELTWKVRPRNHFSTNASFVSVNNRFAGKVAGVKTKDGSVIVKIGCEGIYSHYIVFTMVNGRHPDKKLIHLNGNRTDNRIENISEGAESLIDDAKITHPGLSNDMFRTIGELPVDYLRECLSYYPDSGELIWNDRPPSHFKSHSGYANYKSRFIGSVAGNVNEYGYRNVVIDGVRFKAHRICYAIYHGSHPIGMIDHINGNRDDNRIGNLRCVDRVGNARNMSKYSNNTSGHTGVALRRDSGRYRAFINDEHGKRKNLGTFKSLDDAVEARKQAEIKYGYHDRHGK